MARKESEEELVFHYSRERRLESASEAVRRLNDPSGYRKPTLFGTLTANRSLAFLFLGIIVLSATALITAYLVPSADQVMFRGNELRLSAFGYEGATYVALKKTAKKDAYLGPVTLHASSGGAAATREFVFGPAAGEEFKFKLDGVGEWVEVALADGERAVVLKTKSK